MSTYEFGKLIGILVGFVAGIFLVAVLLTFARGKHWVKEKCNYDERQRLVRGKGFQYGFFVLLIGCAILTCFGSVLAQFIGYPIMIFFVLCLGVLTYAVYCIINDGYFALNDKPIRFHIIFIILAIVNVVLGIAAIYQDEHFALADPLPSGIINLITAGVLFAIETAFLLKQCLKKEVV